MSDRVRNTAFDQLVADEAQRIIIDVLNSSLDGRANSELLTIILRRYGVMRDRAWVQAQLVEMSKARLVRIAEIGSILVVEVTN